jgi:glyoxylase-like metal-dependent hydrolase (beta-lactamase superfamily II)
MPVFDRRQFLGLNAAALAGAALTTACAVVREPGTGRMAPIDRRDSAPGFYRFTLGDMELTVLNDGSFRLPAAVPGIDMSPHEFLALNADPATREAYFRSRMVPADNIPLESNPVLIDTGRHRVLVDSGGWVGDPAPPTVGRLGAALEAAGIVPGSIDTVVVTHGHPDHLGGMVDAATGTPRFPNAQVVLSDVELDLWTGVDAEARFRDGPLPLPMIQAVFRALDDRLRPIRTGDEVVGGIRSLASPGHTTGHLCLAVESGGNALLLTGDAITNIHGAFERPDWQNLFDQEPEMAGRTRQRLLDQVATDRMPILGYHFPFPGLGYAVRDDAAYRWYPAGWTVLP